MVRKLSKKTPRPERLPGLEDTVRVCRNCLGVVDSIPCLACGSSEYDTVARAALPKASDLPFVVASFTIVRDTAEREFKYRFEEGLFSNADQGNRPIRVPCIDRALPVCDYAIYGFDGGLRGAAVERKTLHDLYGSVARRDNFEARLDRMVADYEVSAVHVEASFEEVYGQQPKWTKFSPKSLYRTITAWEVRYPTIHFKYFPSRLHSEVATYRFLDEYQQSHRENKLHGQREHDALIRRREKFLHELAGDHAEAVWIDPIFGTRRTVWIPHSDIRSGRVRLATDDDRR